MYNGDIPTLFSEKDLQSYQYIWDNLIYLQIILRRLEQDKQLYIEKFNSRESYEISRFLILDFKSMYIFSKIYLDYLVRYVKENFFPNVKGLSERSFEKHLNSLYNVKNEDPKFIRYKEYFMKNGMEIYYKVVNIRDKLITHRLTKRTEGLMYDDKNHIISLVIENTKNYIYDEEDNFKFNSLLKEKILKLAEDQQINLNPHDTKTFSDFAYLSYVLDEIESNFHIDDKLGEFKRKKLDKNYRKLHELRQDLGIILKMDGIYKLIVEFTNGLRDALELPKLKYHKIP